MFCRTTSRMPRHWASRSLPWTSYQPTQLLPPSTSKCLIRSRKSQSTKRLERRRSCQRSRGSSMTQAAKLIRTWIPSFSSTMPTMPSQTMLSTIQTKARKHSNRPQNWRTISNRRIRWMRSEQARKLLDRSMAILSRPNQSFRLCLRSSICNPVKVFRIWTVWSTHFWTETKVPKIIKWVVRIKKQLFSLIDKTNRIPRIKSNLKPLFQPQRTDNHQIRPSRVPSMMPKTRLNLV